MNHAFDKLIEDKDRRIAELEAELKEATEDANEFNGACIELSRINANLNGELAKKEREKWMLAKKLQFSLWHYEWQYDRQHKDAVGWSKWAEEQAKEVDD